MKNEGTGMENDPMRDDADTIIKRGRLPRRGGALGKGERPLVSILISVYNHERFIEQCLKSVASQETEFSYEVLIGEDRSPDGTRALLERLEGELPENFVFLYRTRNMGAVPNGQDLYARAQGKYFAGLEGDDFWTYDHKLQEQVSFLEAHPDYSATYTNCVVVGEDGKPNGEKYPQCPFEEYTSREFFYSRMPGHHGTLVCRWPEFLSAYREFEEMKEYKAYAGDRRNAFIFLTLGKVRCFQSEWSAYRHLNKAGETNWCSTIQFDEAYARNEVAFGASLIKWAERHGTPDVVRVAKKTYYRFLLKWSVGKVAPFSLAGSLKELLGESGWPRYLVAPLEWYLVLGMRVLRGNAVDL